MNLFYETCREDYFYVVVNGGVSELIHMDKYETISFINDYLNGKIEKRIVADTQDMVCVYYLPGDKYPVAFSRLMPYGFCEFCRKVEKIDNGCCDFKEVRYEGSRKRVS